MDRPLEDDILLREGIDTAEALQDAAALAIPLGDDAGLDSHARRDLLREERAIALGFHSSPYMWVYPVLTTVCFVVWLSFFPLVATGVLTGWGLLAACAFSTFCCAYGFIPSHEAMHSNIYPRGSKYYWINEFTGAIATVPIAMGFGIARLTHMEHHAHTNDAELDPDFTDGAPNGFRAVLKTWWNRQPGVEGSVHRYKKMMVDMDTPASRRAATETTLLQLAMLATFFSFAWAGYAIEVALIWWLPRQLGLSWIRYWLSWAPHHPQARGRYENTRFFKTRWGHWASMGMQFHAIHHLYPGIPNHRTKPAYFAMKPVLQKRGVDVTAH
jgi:beta-carotene hydroxylase